MNRMLNVGKKLAILIIALVCLGIGGVYADQAFQTTRSTFQSLNPSAYPLKEGFVIATHMNGPVNFEKKEFQVHGAKPNTEFFIFRVFQEDLHLPGGITVPHGTMLYAGVSFWTDEHGDGHIITSLSPTNPTLEGLKATGTTSAHLKNVLRDGMSGPTAYETEYYETVFDWEWS